MLIINNNFSVNNRYVISEQCCSVSVNATSWNFSDKSCKKTNLITKYMVIEVLSYLGSKVSNKVHEHTNQIRCFLCQNMVKYLDIFMLYIVVIKIAAFMYFRQNCNMIISIFYKKNSFNMFWKKKKRKKNLFHKLVKSLNFASKKYNLRKAEGLKLYWIGIFFSSKTQLL